LASINQIKYLALPWGCRSNF